MLIYHRVKVMIFHGEVMSPKANPIWGHDLDYFWISPTSRTSRTMARQSQPSRIGKLRVVMGGVTNSRFGSHHCSRWPMVCWGPLNILIMVHMRVHQNGGIPKTDRLEWNILWQMDDLWMPPRFRNSPVFTQMKSSLWVSHELLESRMADGWLL